MTGRRFGSIALPKRNRSDSGRVTREWDFAIPPLFGYLAEPVFFDMLEMFSSEMFSSEMDDFSLVLPADLRFHGNRLSDAIQSRDWSRFLSPISVLVAGQETLMD